MAYTTSGQMPVGQSFKLGDYTFNLAVNPTGVIATVNDGEKGAAKGASFRNPQIKSWSVEANESEASVYVQFANEPDTYPDYISIIQPPYKLTYNEGEQINLVGIKVRAFNTDGSVWDAYIDGIVPSEELRVQTVDEDENKVFHVATSDLIEEGSTTSVFYSTGNCSLTQNYNSGAGPAGTYIFQDKITIEAPANTKIILFRRIFDDSGPLYTITPVVTSTSLSAIMATKLTSDLEDWGPGPGEHSHSVKTKNLYDFNRHWTKNGKTVYCCGISAAGYNQFLFDGRMPSGPLYEVSNSTTPYTYWPRYKDDLVLLPSGEDASQHKAGLAALSLWYTDDGDLREEDEVYHSATVTISWQRPIDHKSLTASFPIVIKKEISESDGEENG